MRHIALFSLFFVFYLNATFGEESPTPVSMFQPKGRRMNRRMHQVVCASSDYPIPVLEDKDFMLEELCTDLLYRIPLENKYSDWEFALHYLDPLAEFRQRYPNLRLHVSVPDYFLITTSTTEMAHLVAYLVKMQAVSLDVIVDSTTNLGVLYHALLAYRDILPPGKQLSISVSHLISPHALYEQGIIEIVEKVYAIPALYQITDSTFPALSVDLEEFTRYFQNANIPLNKLVIGVPSTHISVTSSTHLSTIPTMVEICNGLELSTWRPVRLEHDQLIWSNQKKSWSFRMLMGSSVTDQIERVRSREFGFMIFDVPFDQTANSVCSWHKEYFVKTIHQAITVGQRPQWREIEVEQSPIVPRWTSIGGSSGGGRLGEILVYATEGEEEAFRNYFNVTDDSSLLDSPIEQVFIGYNSEGEIYDIYQDNCNEEPALSPHLEHLVESYSLETIIREADIYGSLLPPSILIFPGASKVSAVNFLHPAPILITWIQKRPSYPAHWMVDGKSLMEGYFGSSTPRPWYTLSASPSLKPAPYTSIRSSSSIEIDSNVFSKALFIGERCTHPLRPKLPKKLGKNAATMVEITNLTTESSEIIDEMPSYATLELPLMPEEKILTHVENEDLLRSTDTISVTSDNEFSSSKELNESPIDYEISSALEDITEQLPSTTTIIFENTTPLPTNPPLKTRVGTPPSRPYPPPTYNIVRTNTAPFNDKRSRSWPSKFPSMDSYIPSLESITKAFEEAYSKIRNKFSELG